jgi:uncharacterized protein YbjT (DUF2867 family)
LQGVSKFVLVTSIGCDDPLFPLNLFWGVLFWKKQGEVALQRSGLDYTVVRPGGWVGGLGWGEARNVKFSVRLAVVYRHGIFAAG